MLYIISSGNYRVLKEVLPFPSESCLRNYFRPFVNETESRLTNINSVKDTLLKRQELQVDKSLDKIVCVLVVDAFTISILARKNKETKDLSNSFLYLIIPLDIRICPFPVYIERKSSGNVADETFSAINIIAMQSKATYLKIKYVSVDVDKKYAKCFSNSLDY